VLWRVVLYKMETFTLSGDGKGRWGRYGGIHGSYRASEVTVKEKVSCRRGGSLKVSNHSLPESLAR